MFWDLIGAWVLLSFTIFGLYGAIVLIGDRVRGDERSSPAPAPHPVRPVRRSARTRRTAAPRASALR